MLKTRLEHLTDLLNQQQGKIVACEIDLTLYTRKNLLIKDIKQSAYFDQKIAELKAVKARAEETIEIIEKMVIDTKTDKVSN